MRERQTRGTGGKEAYARGRTTPRTPHATGLPQGAREAPTRVVLPPTVMYIHCEHRTKRDRQSRRKSVQRSMELCMPRGCEGEGRLLDATLADPATAGGTPVT